MTPTPARPDVSFTRPLIALACAAACALGAGSASARDDDDDQHTGRFCSTTANYLHRACKSSVTDDFWVAAAKCVNLGDAAERSQCQADAKATRSEANQACRVQLGWRRDACRLTGEARYDPEFNPAFFEVDFNNLAHPNPYFPLKIGNLWTYAGGDQTNTLRVLDQTKLIDGVTCVVVRDEVFENGLLLEDTDDW